ncbi:NADP-dependent malic enzyme [Candidatus Saccharibacteria bacterium]|nr:NADP-dependent malic enzyme [Candidatus Saccharibacteria bacterium]
MTDKKSLKDQTLALHAKNKGKLATFLTTPIKTKEDLSLAYTPGVAEVSLAIAEDSSRVYDYTIKGHTVAIVTDGSAVLGLGNIGAEAALPVMEGKAALFKTFANLDAFPIALNTQDSKEIIRTVKNITPVFGGVNLEDISAPRCFEIEEALQDIGIPVMHDDQHGTAVVVLAALINACKVSSRQLGETKVVVLGAGAAGSAIALILTDLVGNVIILDSKGIIDQKRQDLEPYKARLAQATNKRGVSGNLQKALKNADVFIGVSKGNLLKPRDIKLMNQKPIILAMANPDPEILPDEAKIAGAYIVATGRSDFPNQVNNSLAFPGIFKGALDSRATKITKEMKLKAAEALAALVKDPSPDKIIPGPFDPGVTDAVASAVAKAASKKASVRS